MQPSHPTKPEQSPPKSKSASKPQWTCPFCPLLCDDISLTGTADNRLTAQHTACPRLARSLASQVPRDASRTSEIDGRATDLTEALSQAAHILTNARRPLFGGLTTDVAGARALYELAATHGAILDHLHGDALAAATFAMQDRGAFFTTLSEVRSRADLIIVLGCEPSQRYPRFYERAVSNTRNVELVFVGCKQDSAYSRPAQSILRDQDPFDTLALWSALVETNRKPDAFGESARELAALTERIGRAQYTAIVYEPAALPAPHAALAIEALHRIVKAINRTVRAGALALGGDDGALTVNQSVTWLSGFPLRTRVSYGLPLDHDAHRYSTQRLTANHEVDALLWVSSFAPEPLPESLDDNVPVIVLGHADTKLGTRRGPTVFIPVATPGIDDGGHLFRVDSSVVAHLAAARVSALPSVASVVAELVARRRTA